MTRLRLLLALLAAALVAATAGVAVALADAGDLPPDDPTALLPAPSDPPVSPVAPPGAPGIATGHGFTDLDDVELARALNDFGELGVRWVRFDFDWSLMQPNGPEDEDWAAWDRAVTALGVRGIHVLGLATYTPPWACGCEDTKTPPADPADFGRFAAALARHFGPMGVHDWEIWNEPNLSAFWHPAPDPAAYAALLESASAGIRAEDPGATIVSGGLAPAPDDGTQIAPVTFLSALYAAGAGPAFDAVGHHPYTFPADISVQEPWSAWYQMAGAEVSLRSVMAQNGDEAKPIWLTEFGAPTGGDPAAQIGEDAQAALVTAAFTAVRASPWAGPLFWYSYRDHGTAPDDRENFFGLVRNDFTRKPAFEAYRIAALGSSPGG